MHWKRRIALLHLHVCIQRFPKIHSKINFELPLHYLRIEKFIHTKLIFRNCSRGRYQKPVDACCQLLVKGFVPCENNLGSRRRFAYDLPFIENYIFILPR